MPLTYLRDPPGSDVRDGRRGARLPLLGSAAASGRLPIRPARGPQRHARSAGLSDSTTFGDTPIWTQAAPVTLAAPSVTLLSLATATYALPLAHQLHHCTYAVLFFSSTENVGPILSLMFRPKIYQLTALTANNGSTLQPRVSPNALALLAPPEPVRASGTCASKRRWSGEVRLTKRDGFDVRGDVRSAQQLRRRPRPHRPTRLGHRFVALPVYHQWQQPSDHFRRQNNRVDVGRTAFFR